MEDRVEEIKPRMKLRSFSKKNKTKPKHAVSYNEEDEFFD